MRPPDDFEQADAPAERERRGEGGRNAPARWLRRLLVVGLLLGVSVRLSFSPLLSVFGGAWDHEPHELPSVLSPAARALLDDAFEGVDPARLVDVHAHLAGIGTDGSGCEVNPRMRSWLHPVERTRFEFYLSSAGVTDLARADRQVAERLTALAAHATPPIRVCLLAFDRHYDPDGTVDPEATEFHVPNEWVWEVAGARPDLFVPAISVHPYRTDALTELDRWGERGVRLVKWLPNAMGIDPSSERCDAYYERLRRWDMTLLSHTGVEMAVESTDDQRLGNPLLLRRALDAGVRVIAAHCATLGTDVDLDHPERPRASSFDLFLRMMDEERYEGLLFGELSATILVNRPADRLRTLIERDDLHARLMFGSDYPMPAMNVLVHTGSFVRRGMLSAAEADALGELYEVNPLLFDFALKRTLHLPGSERRFRPEAFEAPELLGL
ncbi:MAG: amidohydrolase family protein [Planctomycetota bacterium]|nr:amidohydrolase family protein [Planctomycetota bacterium]MDP6990303.1 amidohydrolase family protein [Planctomycetota bacterium]